LPLDDARVNDPRVVVDVRDWAARVAALPSAGALPTRTIIVPSEAVAHGLRRELIRQGREDVLLGARFADARTLSLEVLEGADIAVRTGEESLRAVRVRAALRSTRGLKYFVALESTHGWDAAFARTLQELEEAGLSPNDLDAANDPRASDVAAIWRSVLDAAGPSWTRGRCLRGAAGALARDPTLWSEEGHTLALVDGHETAALAGFLNVIPRRELVVQIARPARTGHAERMRRLFGGAAASALGAASGGARA